MAERHAGIDHQIVGQLEEGADGAVEGDPGLLRAGVQAVAARQQADSLQIAADVGPLRRPVRLFAREEQRDRRAEELVIARVLPVTRRLVLARYIDGLVKQLADLETPRLVGLAQR